MSFVSCPCPLSFLCLASMIACVCGLRRSAFRAPRRATVWPRLRRRRRASREVGWSCDESALGGSVDARSRIVAGGVGGARAEEHWRSQWHSAKRALAKPVALGGRACAWTLCRRQRVAGRLRTGEETTVGRPSGRTTNRVWAVGLRCSEMDCIARWRGRRALGWRHR